MTPFEQAIVERMPLLRRVAVNITRTTNDVDDLVQVTVLKALTDKHQFQPGTNLTGWLITILRNTFLERCRRKKFEVLDIDGEAAARLVDEAAGDFDSPRALRDLLAALKALRLDAGTMLLEAADGLQYDEIAARHGVPIGTVKSRMCRARAQLKAEGQHG